LFVLFFFSLLLTSLQLFRRCTHAEALSNVRVLDMSRVLAGPWATQLLADLGADVIKIERPEVGDDTRAWGPPFLKNPDGTLSSESAYYLCANRGKRSVAVDFTTSAGQVRTLTPQFSGSACLISTFTIFYRN
jgi:crotonobetainyl-CoA:carnitine CoA-transferase CaiB-like acyl-CoA transferase